MSPELCELLLGVHLQQNCLPSLSDLPDGLRGVLEDALHQAELAGQHGQLGHTGC